MSEPAKIPIIEVYRGVGLHDCQDQPRLAVVRADIDHVLDQLHDVAGLMSFARDERHAPEARLCAGAKLRALWQISAEDRTPRPPVDLAELAAIVDALDLVGWRSPWRYGSLFCHDAVMRDQSLE